MAKKRTARKMTGTKGGKRHAGPEIVAVPLTRGGSDYLQAVWPALLEGGIGELTLKPDALKLLQALHRVASGGSLVDVTATGGNGAPLDQLLTRSLTEANEINALLGDIRLRS